MFLALVVIAIILLVVWIKWNYSYWQRQGFPYVKANTPFGVLQSVTNGTRSFGLAIYDVYKTRTEKVLGIYLFTRPALLIRDAYLATRIQTKDFNNFHDRGIYVDDVNDPISGNLFSLEGKKWRNLRAKLTPIFTTGKLKAMFETSDDVGNKMLNHLNSIVPENGSSLVEMKKVMSTYAVDIIASVIFGLSVDSFKDPKNEFNAVSEAINAPTFKNIIHGTCQFLYPPLEKLFIRFGWQVDGQRDMQKLVHDTIELREKNNIVRKDVIQLLLQLRNQGELNANDNEWTTKTGGSKLLSTDFIAAQLFLFYAAGFETTASTISFTLYELAQNPDLLEKAQKEVEEVLQKHQKLSYDALQDMKFMDLCINETIRKYPALPILNRICTEDYRIPDTNQIIKKGTPILISLFGIHRDPEYYENPLKYDPDRFSESNRNYDTDAYMPFGTGPRNCIGLRMGRLNTKIALTKVLSNFNVHTKSYPEELEFDNHGVGIIAKDGINVRLSKKINKIL